MNKKYPHGIWILLVIAAIIFTACSAQAEETTGNDASSQSADVNDLDEDEADDHATDGDHEEDAGDHMDGEDDLPHGHVEVPAEFADLNNPFADSREAIEAGEMTYNNLCASCHGESGDGGGPAAASLTPPPAKFSDGAMMSVIGDDYLFWRISKGGAIDPFNSAMPAWEGALTEEQRWQVISYVRTFASNGNEHMDSDHMDDDHDK